MGKPKKNPNMPPPKVPLNGGPPKRRGRGKLGLSWEGRRIVKKQLHQLHEAFSTRWIEDPHDRHQALTVQNIRYEMLLQMLRMDLQQGGAGEKEAMKQILAIMREQNKLLGLIDNPNVPTKSNQINTKDLLVDLSNNSAVIEVEEDPVIDLEILREPDDQNQNQTNDQTS